MKTPDIQRWVHYRPYLKNLKIFDFGGKAFSFNNTTVFDIFLAYPLVPKGSNLIFVLTQVYTVKFILKGSASTCFSFAAEQYGNSHDLGPEIIMHSLWKGVNWKLPQMGRESLGSRNRKHLQKGVKTLF